MNNKSISFLGPTHGTLYLDKWDKANEELGKCLLSTLGSRQRESCKSPKMTVSEVANGAVVNGSISQMPQVLYRK